MVGLGWRGLLGLRGSLVLVGSLMLLVVRLVMLGLMRRQGGMGTRMFYVGQRRDRNDQRVWLVVVVMIVVVPHHFVVRGLVGKLGLIWKRVVSFYGRQWLQQQQNFEMGMG